MQHSHRFICALVGVAFAIPVTLSEPEPKSQPAAFKTGRLPVAAGNTFPQPSNAKRLVATLDTRPQNLRDENPTVVQTIQVSTRSLGEAARDSREQYSTHSFGEQTSAARAEDWSAEFPVELDVPNLTPGAISFRATGFDPAGPRALTLWRVGENKSAQLAEAISDAKGDFDFGAVLIPIRGISLVATGYETPPTAEQMRNALSLRSDLPPPRIVWLESEHADYSFQVYTSIAEGSVVLEDAQENLIARYDVSRGSGQLAIDLETDEDAVWIAHELPDGRSSNWRILELGMRKDEAGFDTP